MSRNTRQWLDDPVFSQALTAATQAIAGRTGLQVALGNGAIDTPLQSQQMVVVTPSHPTDDSDPLRTLRGQCDLAALAMRYHDAAYHYAHRPRSDKAASVYDALEQMRLEALGTLSMDGVRDNLAHRMEVYCQVQGYARLSEQAEPPLADIIALLARERLTGEPPPESVRALVNLWRGWVEQGAGDALKRLEDALDNQQSYTDIVRELLTSLELVPKQEAATQPTPSPQDAESPPDAEDTSDNSSQTQDQMQAGSGSSEQDSDENQQPRVRPMGSDDEDGGEEALGERPMHHAPNYPTGMTPYKQHVPYAIFTRDFDEIIDADQLASTEELALFRAQLDEKLKAYHNVHSRLATRLQRLLLARQQREWLYDQEDGLIDNARLARLVIHPDMTDIYKMERESEFRDTVVTLLIDNSGSMRGRPITIAALSADILARTLERCGVKVEILGFTTRDWKGGMSRKLWEKRDRPHEPGRLNDIRHIIYKSADMRLNKTRRNLGLMLKDGLLKENIDGEAVLWAYNRLMQRPEQRRILMVISDGAPVDDSTLSSNSSGYLDRHLRDVIRSIETQGQVELLAIGIGHDVTRYYQRAVTINDVDQLGDTMMQEMTKLFSEDTMPYMKRKPHRLV